jgi:hypothetical protein
LVHHGQLAHSDKLCDFSEEDAIWYEGEAEREFRCAIEDKQRIVGAMIMEMQKDGYLVTSTLVEGAANLVVAKHTKAHSLLKYPESRIPVIPLDRVSAPNTT